MFPTLPRIRPELFGFHLKHPTSLFAFDRRERPRISDSSFARNAFGALVALCALGLATASAEAQEEAPTYLPDLSQPMQFHLAGTLGNCNSCTWISAQGRITRDTPSAFTAFVEANKDSFEGTNIHLNSRGGDLGAALALGRLIRESGYGTVVAETAGQKGRFNDQFLVDSFLDRDNPVCVSACVFAFVGGTNLAASKRTLGEEVGYQKTGRLAVHQFYSLNESDTGFGSAERIKDQFRTAFLLEYLVDMGISADLLARAFSVPPEDDLYWLTEEDIKSYGLDTFFSDVTPNLRGYENGVGVVEIQRRTRRGDYRYEFFCSPEQQAMMKLTLSIFEWTKQDDPNWVNQEWQFNFQNFIEGLRVPLPGEPTLLSYTLNQGPEGYGVVELVFASANTNMKALIGKTAFDFWHDGSSYATFLALDMSFWLPEPFDGFHLLPRLCLN
ncbi:MAG: hypothetical protein AB3N11_03060 [Arenibacterium sp.]